MFDPLKPTEYYLKRKPTQPIDYEAGYWDTAVDPDGKTRHRLEERDMYLDDIKEELSFIESLAAGRILDVGCGLGFLLSAVNDQWDKYGIEISALAAQNASLYGDIKVCDLTEANYETDFFDLIVMHHVIEHLTDPIATIIEVRRILRPGGKLLMATPDFDSGCARLFGENYRLLHDHTHISLFSNESMYRFLRDHGFIVDFVRYPFFETRHFTKENLMKLFDTHQISPPFYGNFMTFYCHKPVDID